MKKLMGLETVFLLKPQSFFPELSYILQLKSRDISDPCDDYWLFQNQKSHK